MGTETSGPPGLAHPLSNGYPRLSLARGFRSTPDLLILSGVKPIDFHQIAQLFGDRICIPPSEPLKEHDPPGSSQIWVLSFPQL